MLCITEIYLLKFLEKVKTFFFFCFLFYFFKYAKAFRQHICDPVSKVLFYMYY